LCATILSAGLVVIGHLVVRQGRGLEGDRRSWALTSSEVLLVVLTLPTLASCAQKLLLYVDAYGQTYLRLGVGLIVIGAVPLLGLLAVQSLRPAWKGFGASTSLVALTVFTGAGFFDADFHVARTNVERAVRGRPLDAEYLGTLGSRVLLGYAAARPATTHGEARWRETLHALERSAPSASSADRRGYRRTVTCAEALGEACAELAPPAQETWR